MPGFMFISGYFAVKDINSLGDVRKRILYSVQHYALPFLSWFFLIDVFLLGTYNRNIIIAVNSIVEHIDRGMWFLWVIFVLSCFATVCNYICTKEKMKVVKMIVNTGICVSVLLLFVGKYGINWGGIKFILYYSVFYGAGWLTRRGLNIYEREFVRYWTRIVGIAVVIFAGIVFNYDLYHCEDDFVGITMRCFAGFTGIVILMWIAYTYRTFWEKIKMDRLGLYTLEVYTTHMWVNRLMEKGNKSEFFTPAGFVNFTISLFLTVGFTLILIAILKSIPLTDFLLYGKKNKRKFI